MGAALPATLPRHGLVVCLEKMLNEVALTMANLTTADNGTNQLLVDIVVVIDGQLTTDCGEGARTRIPITIGFGVEPLAGENALVVHVEGVLVQNLTILEFTPAHTTDGRLIEMLLTVVIRKVATEEGDNELATGEVGKPSLPIIE